jgi:hypothetical protein
MRSRQVLFEFEKLISHRGWYKKIELNRYQASSIKRRFKAKELGFGMIVKLLKDSGYNIFVFKSTTSDNDHYTTYSLSNKQVELLTIVGYFNSHVDTDTPNVISAIDFLRQTYKIACAVNLFWDNKDKDMPYKYTYGYVDPFHHNKHHAGNCWFNDYESAAKCLLDELLSLDL